jgi:hypothetical protein
MYTSDIPERSLERLTLNRLARILDQDIQESNFKFLGLGQLFLNYKIELVEVDAMAARLAGNESEHDLKRTAVKSESLNVPIPESSTHYYLGEPIAEEELYLNHKSNSSSRDTFPIIFLKELK